MESFTIHELVQKLIGPIEPVGETNTDDVRFENLHKMTDLVEKLLMEIQSMAYRNKNRQEFSMNRSGLSANKFLKECLENYIEP